MPLLSGLMQGNAAPANVASGDYTYTVIGTHVCGGTPQPFVLDDSLGMTPGRYVLLRATVDITGYAGVSLTPPTGLALASSSLEFVNYSGTNYKCIVVTLVAA